MALGGLVLFFYLYMGSREGTYATCLVGSGVLKLVSLECWLGGSKGFDSALNI